MVSAVDLAYPFEGRWLTQNSPANRVPSHGTALFATSFAIDFVPVNEAGRTAPITFGSLVRPEPAERFPGFGRPILAPVHGLVVGVHDTAPDHRAFRGLPSVGYALTQRRRAAGGWVALAGNHVMIETRDGSGDRRVPPATRQRPGSAWPKRSGGPAAGALRQLRQQHRTACPPSGHRPLGRAARLRCAHHLRRPSAPQRRNHRRGVKGNPPPDKRERPFVRLTAASAACLGRALLVGFEPAAGRSAHCGAVGRPSATGVCAVQLAGFSNVEGDGVELFV